MKDRPLLHFENGVMTCTSCLEFFKDKTGAGKNTFITGSSNFKVSSVCDHESSKSHAKAVEAKLAKQKGQAMQSSDAGKALLSLKTAERYVLASLFRNAHAVAKRGRPLTDNVWICEAIAAQGVDVGSTYLNEKACAKFLTFIADAETDMTRRQVEATPFFSIMMDGSQYRSKLEQESINMYIRTAVEGFVTEIFNDKAIAF